MDDDDIYGSILSDPKSNSNSNKYSERYSETNLQQQQQQSSQYSHSNQHVQGQGQAQFSVPSVPPQSSLFISNLTWWTSEDDIRQLLGDLSNRIKELQFLENKPNGKSKGMVIVEFVDVATAEVAKGMLEGRDICGRVCEVSFARNPPVKPFERSAGNYNTRGDRPIPRKHYRLDQQYHQIQNQRQGHEVSYHQHHHHPQQQDEYGHGSSRHVHVNREETVVTSGGSSGYDHRGSSSSSSRYRGARSHDDRSRSPDRKSSIKSRRY